MSESLLGLTADAPTGIRLPAELPAAEPALVEALVRGIRTGAAALPDGDRDAAAIASAALAAEHYAVDRYRELGIPADVMAHSLADVGRKIATYGRTVDLPWLVRVLRGDVLAFGRVQLERQLVDGRRALHIPEGGALHSEEVDQSIATGLAFLGDEPVSCTSWLLDPVLQQQMPHSNIAAFARRFRVDEVVRSEKGDRAVVKFVFRIPLAEVLDQPAETATTSVQRLVLSWLRSGQHWAEPTGLLSQ